jgi:hypothetical protein
MSRLVRYYEVVDECAPWHRVQLQLLVAVTNCKLDRHLNPQECKHSLYQNEITVKRTLEGYRDTKNSQQCMILRLQDDECKDVFSDDHLCGNGVVINVSKTVIASIIRVGGGG